MILPNRNYRSVGIAGRHPVDGMAELCSSVREWGCAGSWLRFGSFGSSERGRATPHRRELPPSSQRQMTAGFGRRLQPSPLRSRTFGTRTLTSPIPVCTVRSGRCPLRTTAWRPSSSRCAAYWSRKPASSASTARAMRSRAPCRSKSCRPESTVLVVKELGE